MNPPITTRDLSPQVTVQDSFNLFKPIWGTLYLANRSASQHCAAISESYSPENNSILKNAGRKNNFEVKNVERKKPEIQNHINLNNINTNSNHTNLNHKDLINSNLPKIKPNNDLVGFFALQQILPWDSMYAEASDFSTITLLVHNYVSLVHTSSPIYPYYPIPAPYHISIFTHVSIEPPPPLHDTSSSPASVAPKDDPTPRNNPPNPVPNVPADPDSDPISSYSTSLDSSKSSDSRYHKQLGGTKRNIRVNVFQ